MPDRIARLALVIGLTPLAVGLTVGALEFLGVIARPPSISPYLPGGWYAVILSSTTFVVVATVLWTWRLFVRWSAIRLSTTAALTLLLFGQIVAWHPIVNQNGCGANDSLVGGQSLASVGLWAIGGALSWWGLKLFRKRNRISAREKGKLTMPIDIARMALGLALTPLLFGIAWMCTIVLPQFLPGQQGWSLFITLEICAIVGAILWFCVWRHRVAWNRTRRLGTAALAAGLIAAQLVAFLPHERFSPVTGFVDGLSQVVQFSLPFLAFAAWFMGTAWLWRRTDEITLSNAAIADEVTCPACNYSLKGLKEVHCPECGWTSTVDQIVKLAFENAATV